jgi:hypothetical protein
LEPTPKADVEADVPEVELDEEGNPIEPVEGEDEPAKEADTEAEPELDEDGKPKVEEKPKEGTPEPKLGADGKPIPEVKKPDAINDPIPKDLGAETQTRIRSLIKTAKEADAKVAEATQNLDYIVKGVQATGTTPQQYGEVLSWMQLFNSGDAIQQAKALELAEIVCDKLAGLLGKERAPTDALTGFDDLKQAVQQGQITRQWATQLALQRRQQKTRGDIETSARTQQETTTAAATELETARVDLNTLETQLMATDKDFAAKKKLLIPVLQPLFQTIPPSQWKEKFQLAYKNCKVSTAGSALAAQRRGSGQMPADQPQRAKQSAGGGARQPANMGEAINAALAQLRK